MARRPSRSPAPRSRRTRTASIAPSPARAWLTLVGAKLRDLAVGLSLVSAVSYLPPSLVQTWPSRAQTAVEIAGNIRTLLADVARDAAAGAGGLLGRLGAAAGPAITDLTAGLTERLTAHLPPDLAHWLPSPAPMTGSVPAGALPRVSTSFTTAKTLLYDQVYKDHGTTLYCGCNFDRNERTELRGCGLQAYAGQTRADRVEAEHVFPASQFGAFRRCWREPAAFPECREGDGDLMSGRSCCLRVDPVFIAAHNDLHNLVPAVGHINGQRSNHNWGWVSGGKRYGTCEIRIDSSTRRVQPPAAVRGDIARIMLYMRDTYQFRLSSQDEQLYAAWSNTDPPDAWEIERDRRIARLQGIPNKYVNHWRF